MFCPMLFWMQAAQICIENGGIVTQVCTFIHLRGKGGIQFRQTKKGKQIQRGQFDWVFVVEENACLSFCCQRLQKVVVAVSLGGKNILGKQSEIT